LTEILKIC